METSRRIATSLIVVLLALGLASCAVLKKRAPAPAEEVEADFTPVPTVPPRTPTPPQAKPLPTRPLKNPEADRARKAGKAIGPVVTFAGITRADGFTVEPISVDKKGVSTFRNYVGSGFQIVVEGKPGISNLEIGRRTYGRDPNTRPDLEIQVNRPLGDGSKAVCDRRRPNIGGIPAINPPTFSSKAPIAPTLNDFSCRFETMIEAESSCVVNKHGEFKFITDDAKTQFCMVVARAWNFPVGETLVSVRLRDAEGNPGPVKTFRLLRPKSRPTPKRPKVSQTPTPRRRRP